MATEAHIPTFDDRLERMKLSKYHVLIYFATCLGQFFDGYDSFIIIYATPILATLMVPKLTPFDIGNLGTINNMGLLIGAIGFGSIADKIGRKRAFNTAILLYVAGTFATILYGAVSLQVLEIIRFITALGLGGEIPVCFAIMSEWTPKRMRGPVLGMVGFLFSISIVTAGAVASYLFKPFGWQIGFWIGSIPVLVVLIVGFCVPESARALVMKKKFAQAFRQIEGMERKQGVEVPSKRLLEVPPALRRAGLLELWGKRYRKVTAGLWGYMFLSYWNWGLFFLLPILLNQVLGFSVADAIFLSFLPQVMPIFVNGAQGWIMDIVGRKRWLAFLVALCATGTVLMPFGRGNWWMELLALNAFSIGGSFVPVSLIFVSENYDTAVRGTANGAASAVSRLGQAIAPMMGGILWAMHYNVWIIFGAFAIPGYLAIPFFLLTKETKKRGLEEISRKKEELQNIIEVPLDTVGMPT